MSLFFINFCWKSLFGNMHAFYFFAKNFIFLQTRHTYTIVTFCFVLVHRIQLETFSSPDQSNQNATRLYSPYQDLHFQASVDFYDFYEQKVSVRGAYLIIIGTFHSILVYRIQSDTFSSRDKRVQNAVRLCLTYQGPFFPATDLGLHVIGVFHDFCDFHVDIVPFLVLKIFVFQIKQCKFTVS